MSAELTWHRGTDEGTAGKDKDGKALWWDGDCLLVIVETNKGREIATVRISCDDEMFELYDSNGDVFPWELSDISWWAKLDKTNLPEKGE